MATLGQISGGRLTLHVITGGNDHEQQREGDTLPKDQRYARTREAIQIYERAWTEREPFDFHGEHYSFDDFVLDVEPAQQPRTLISLGGSAARRLDGSGGGQLHRARRHAGDGGRRPARLLRPRRAHPLRARGYDLLEDAKEFGREVTPLVRAEVARRELAAVGSFPVMSFTMQP